MKLFRSLGVSLCLKRATAELKASWSCLCAAGGGGLRSSGRAVRRSGRGAGSRGGNRVLQELLTGTEHATLTHQQQVYLFQQMIQTQRRLSGILSFSVCVLSEMSIRFFTKLSPTSVKRTKTLLTCRTGPSGG